VKPDDQNLLVNIFTVPQCDRTEEGDAFIPPDPKLVRKVKFVTVLRSHVKQCSNFSAQLKVNTRLSPRNMAYIHKLRSTVGEEMC